MEWLRDHAWETWLGLTIVPGVAEMFSLDLILIMLAAGALVGMITAVIGLPIALRVPAAAAASLAAIAMVRPTMVKRLHHGPELSLGHGKLVGKQGTVTEEVSSPAAGRIKLAGEFWTAEPYDETTTIAAGETVEVLEIRGATAIVHPVARLES
ncbi:NfeD family protein [Nocardioides sp. B-3]|uniref:NfeD family protein n=1 Tax=Nocardioides sp. B-3 TaxID=2895565 RepID=UPI0021535550|nr:NfeD family protein [Nocardioides sp. B-3]UUZ59190.1 NfeD family protein [Nocardioides sp. B-3]